MTEIFEADENYRYLLEEMAEKLYDIYGDGDEWFTSDGKRFKFYDEKDGESVSFSFSLDQSVIKEDIDWEI